VDSVLNVTGDFKERLICGTKGSHIIVGGFPGAPVGALYVEAQRDGRPFFIIPWNGLFLIGTTDFFYTGSLDQVAASSEEVDYLISETNRVIPSAKLAVEKVLYTYSGIRPLPCVEGERESRITRRHIIHDHSTGEMAGPAVQGLISIVGGKLTTYRSLAEQAVDLIFKKLDRSAPRCLTADEPLPGAKVAAEFARPAVTVLDRVDRTFAEFREHFRICSKLTERTTDHLLRVYGVRASEVVALSDISEDLSEVIDSDTGAIAAEILFAFKQEMSRKSVDAIDRRTMIGLGPSRGRNVIDRASSIAKRHLALDTI
ncbi:MAG: FAD-dependent oxidoreductase, partial [Blastocatellia bacterium]